jgi:hypothetical protein
MSNILFTAVPQGIILGQTQWKNTSTSKVQRLFRNLKSDDWKSIQVKGYDVVCFQAISDREQTDKITKTLEIGSFIKDVRQVDGCYQFISCPITKKINGLPFVSGILIYNEAGTIYYIFYYVQLDNIYAAYCKRNKSIVAYSNTIVQDELLNYLLNYSIPRLIKSNST